MHKMGDGPPGSSDDAGAGQQPVLAAIRPVEKRVFHANLTPLMMQHGSFGGVTVVPLKEEVDAFVLEGVMSPEETARLRAKTEELQYTFWHEDNSSEKRGFRSADTVEVVDQALADCIWERVQSRITQTITIAEGDARWERGFGGTWHACGVNEHLLFAKYTEGGHFSPHTDGYTIVDFNRRSLYSMLVYLNDCEVGGATRIFSKSEDSPSAGFVTDDGGRFRYDESKFVDKAKVRDGTALLFFQDLVHEGEPVGPGCSKYIIRTDLMYERRPRIFDSDRDRKAYGMIRQAELLEGDGKAVEAAKQYRLACKLSPGLADCFGI